MGLPALISGRLIVVGLLFAMAPHTAAGTAWAARRSVAKGVDCLSESYAVPAAAKAAEVGSRMDGAPASIVTVARACELLLSETRGLSGRRQEAGFYRSVFFGLQNENFVMVMNCDTDVATPAECQHVKEATDGRGVYACFVRNSMLFRDARLHVFAYENGGEGRLRCTDAGPEYGSVGTFTEDYFPTRRPWYSQADMPGWSQPYLSGSGHTVHTHATPIYAGASPSALVGVAGADRTAVEPCTRCLQHALAISPDLEVSLEVATWMALHAHQTTKAGIASAVRELLRVVQSSRPAAARVFGPTWVAFSNEDNYRIVDCRHVRRGDCVRAPGWHIEQHLYLATVVNRAVFGDHARRDLLVTGDGEVVFPAASVLSGDYLSTTRFWYALEGRGWSPEETPSSTGGAIRVAVTPMTNESGVAGVLRDASQDHLCSLSKEQQVCLTSSETAAVAATVAAEADSFLSGVGIATLTDADRACRGVHGLVAANMESPYFTRVRVAFGSDDLVVVAKCTVEGPCNTVGREVGDFQCVVASRRVFGDHHPRVFDLTTEGDLWQRGTADKFGAVRIRDDDPPLPTHQQWYQDPGWSAVWNVQPGIDVRTYSLLSTRGTVVVAADRMESESCGLRDGEQATDADPLARCKAELARTREVGSASDPPQAPSCTTAAVSTAGWVGILVGTVAFLLVGTAFVHFNMCGIRSALCPGTLGPSKEWLASVGADSGLQAGVTPVFMGGKRPQMSQV